MMMEHHIKNSDNMKVRIGFVSNSSSSSYVILLPEHYTLTIETINNYLQNDDKEGYLSDGLKPEDVLSSFGVLKKEGTILFEDMYRESSVLSKMLKDYIVAEVPTGPDGGQLVLAEPGKVKKITGEH
jgi:hypothetical protein